jgi:hypothetical protein
VLLGDTVRLSNLILEFDQVNDFERLNRARDSHVVLANATLVVGSYLTLILFIRLMKYFQLNRKLNVLAATLRTALVDLIPFTIMAVRRINQNFSSFLLFFMSGYAWLGFCRVAGFEGWGWSSAEIFSLVLFNGFELEKLDDKKLYFRRDASAPFWIVRIVCGEQSQDRRSLTVFFFVCPFHSGTHCSRLWFQRYWCPCW